MGILKRYLARIKTANQSAPKKSESVDPQTNKTERFTEAARNVLRLAQAEAERLEHEKVGPEHILVGLLQQESYAQQVLVRAKVEVALVMAQVEQLTESVPKVKQVQNLSDETKRVLELAVDETRRLYFHQITSHQLLIGILRQEKNLAVKCLQMLNIDTVRLLKDSRLHTKVMIEEVGRTGYIQFENTLPAK